MAGTFPTLIGGHSVMYPFRVRYSCLTRVLKATNGAEQRFVVRPAMVEMDLTYRNLAQADVDAIDNFFDSQKGAFDSTWNLAFGGNTYTKMRFLEDQIRWEETLPNRWTTRLRCSGFHPTVTGAPATFPPLDSGAVTQRPWSKRRVYDTNHNDLEVGVRHALAFRGGGLSNFPTGPARAWDVQYPSISATEAERLVKFFLSQNGRSGVFDFTDPDTSVTYNGCRFASDDLEVQYVGFNNCATAVTIEKN